MFKKSLLFFILSVFILSIFTTATVSAFSIDISICNDPSDMDTYNACIAQFQPIFDEAHDVIQSELNAQYTRINGKDSDYVVCTNQVCALGSSDPQTGSKTIETYEDQMNCINSLCVPIRDEVLKKIKELKIKQDNKMAEYFGEFCTNCLAPYCSYKQDSNCQDVDYWCEQYTGKVIFMGCGNADISSTSSSQTPQNPNSTNMTTKNQVTSTKNPVPNTNNQNPAVDPQNKAQTTNTPSTIIQKQLTKLTSNPVVKVYPIENKDGTKNVILTNPDNSKANFVDKKNYYIDDMLKKKSGDIIGDIPVLGPYKDYIIKYFDDQKSDAQKTADTQVKLGIGKNAATQFNKMDGTGDTELKLSTGKNLITSTPVTKPFEFVLTQLGNGVKKTMAHGFKSEYESTLEQARVLRKAGLSWSDTIKQTTNLVGEETDGKRWVQTLNAFSKKDYQTQDARIKTYIMQMKINGELK